MKQLTLGAYAKVLNNCKLRSNDPTQLDLINTVLSSVYPPYIVRALVSGIPHNLQIASDR
jgi:hypothetical protein